MEQFNDLLLQLVRTALPTEQIIGCAEQELKHTEDRLGGQLPQILTDFYTTVGRVPQVMDSDHHFVPAAKLEVSPGSVVFCYENQNICFWAFDGQQMGQPDPPVVRGTTQGIQWEPDTKQLSRFLIHHTCWQLVMALPATGRTSLEPWMIPRLRKHMTILYPELGSYMSSLVDYTRQVLVSVLKPSEELYVAAQNDQALEDFVQRVGIEIDWL